MFKKNLDKNNTRQLWQSQNFLKNSEFVAHLIEKADISREDLVIEIGLGKGIITRILASKARRVIGIEIDLKLVKELRLTLKSLNNIELVQADFFKMAIAKKSFIKSFLIFLLI